MASRNQLSPRSPREQPYRSRASSLAQLRRVRFGSSQNLAPSQLNSSDPRAAQASRYESARRELLRLDYPNIRVGSRLSVVSTKVLPVTQCLYHVLAVLGNC